MRATQSLNGATATIEGIGGGANPAWVSTTHSVAETGRLEGEREEGLPTVSAGRAGGANPEAEEDRQRDSGHGSASRRSQPALEHGFHERSNGRWMRFSDLD